MKTYRTVQGDLWDSIAQQQMGDAAYTDQLMRANLPYLWIYRFPAGITLNIPEPVMDNTADLPPWRRNAT